MGLVYLDTYFFHKFKPNVGKYTSPMDPMDYCDRQNDPTPRNHLFFFSVFHKKSHLHLFFLDLVLESEGLKSMKYRNATQEEEKNKKLELSSPLASLLGK